MFTTVIRIVWRILVFSLGAVLLWFALFTALPYADERMPQYIALLILYCVFAYGVIPLLFRLLRLFIKPDHIPLYVVSGDGWPSDPVNLALVVRSKRHLQDAMQNAGWVEADPLTFRTGWRELISIVFNTPYPAAPLSNLYLFGRSQDIGFEISTNRAKSARTRHHVRFWKLDEPQHGTDDGSGRLFWRRKLEHLLGIDSEIWIGAATEETHPIDIRWRNGQLTHGGNHDADRERDFIINSLYKAKHVARVRTSKPGKQITFRGQQFRTIYVTDGSIKVVDIK